MRAPFRAAALAALLVAGCGAQTDRRETPSARWDTLARRFVDARGRVDYAGLRSEPSFARLVAALATFEPSSLPDDAARLAFWINAYNILTIHGVLERLPTDPTEWPAWKPTSIRVDGKPFWKGVAFRVANRTLTLDAIEHDVIRGDRRYRDPRIHVALVCAARGCPPLLDRAYRGPRLAVQLDARMRRELTDTGRTEWRGIRAVRVSQVFTWYRDDFTNETFTPHADTLGAFLARYVADAAKARALADGSCTIEFREYDWRLNLRPSR